MNENTPKNNHVRGKLLLVEMLILAIPISVLSYIFFQGGYRWEPSHLILFGMLIMLILIGLIIVRQIFDRISMVAVSLKRVESGDMVVMDIKHDVDEFHEISDTFNNLVQKLEVTSRDLRKSHLDLLIIKDLAEAAKGERNIDRLFDLLLQKSMIVTDAKTGSVLMVQDTAPSNKDLVMMERDCKTASECGSFKKFRVIAAKGHCEALVKDSFIDVNNYVAKNVLMDGKPLLVHDIENDSRILKTNDPKYGPPSFLSMPIFAENRLVAVINLSNKSQAQLFDDNDIKVISIILDEVGFALENAMMHSVLENRLKIIKGHNLELEKQIEAHRRTEKELFESKKKYEELLNFLPISVFETDPRGNFTTLNRTSLETFGYSKDDNVRRLNALNMFIPEDLDRVKSDIQKVLTGGKMDSAPYTMIRKDGSTLSVLISAKPISHMNTIVGFRGAVIDYTERKQAEQALEREHMLLQNLINNVPDRIYAKDAASRFIICNEAMIRRMGKTIMSEVVGRSDFDLLPPEMAQRFYDDEQEIIRTGIPMINREEPLEMEGGKITRWSLATKVPMLDKQGNRIGIVGVGREITDLKRAMEELHKAKEQLLQAEKLAALGRLSAGVAHEILNPVNIISMELQMLQAMGNLSPEIMEELEICMAQTERIVKITQSLTKLSRLPIRKTAMTDINDVVTEILNLYAKQLMIEGIEIETHYQSHLPLIDIDKEMMGQIFMNLISNAIDAMEGKENKVLRIRTEREKTPGGSDHLKITISDTGMGINSEHMSKIFDPFFTTKEPGKGTGLGLSISYGIIHDHGGMIWATNNDWGGASFYVTVPIKMDA